MKFRDLYLRCSNFHGWTDLTIEEGKEVVNVKLCDAFNKLLDRHVIWFTVESDFSIRLVLKEKDSK